MRRSARSQPGFGSSGLHRFAVRAAEGALWLWLAVVWFVNDEGLKDAFRLPKEAVSQPLVLASLFFLALALADAGQVPLSRIVQLPALRSVLPLVLAALLSWPFSEHPDLVARGLLLLVTSAAALVAWSVGLGRERLWRLLRGLMAPAALLSLVGILQHHAVFRPFDFQGNVEADRLGITSFAGSAGELAVFLVLPVLVGQLALFQAVRQKQWPWCWAWGGGLGLCLYAVAVTQTLTAVAALAAGTALLWTVLLPTRRAVAGLALVAVAAGLGVAAVEPLRARVGQKVRMLAQGEINSVLTGRLDGWRAAVRMLEENPLTGVGHGAYASEFAEAKLALVDEGVEFLRSQTQVMFANAHNEPLEVAAETGLLGIVALLWGCGVLFVTLRRLRGPPGARALAWAGTVALLLLSLGQFPFRLSLTAVPAVLFLAWIFAVSEADAGKKAEEEEG